MSENNYVNNKDFYSLIVEYRKTKSKKIHNQLGRIFIQISKKYLMRPNLCNYSLDRREDMVSDSCFYMTKAIAKYNLEEINPFGYFSKIAENAYLQFINKTKKRDKMFVRLDLLDNDDNLKSSNKYSID